MESNVSAAQCPKCGAIIDYDDGYCKSCWSSEEKTKTVTQDTGTLKPRMIVSIIGAILVMTPIAIQRPDKIVGILLFVLVSFIAIFIISSLINIKDSKMRIIFFTIAGLSFAYKFYASYFLMHMVLSKALNVSLVFAAVFALIFRGISLFLEKKQA